MRRGRRPTLECKRGQGDASPHQPGHHRGIVAADVAVVVVDVQVRLFGGFPSWLSCCASVSMDSLCTPSSERILWEFMIMIRGLDQCVGFIIDPWIKLGLISLSLYPKSGFKIKNSICFSFYCIGSFYLTIVLGWVDINFKMSLQSFQLLTNWSIWIREVCWYYTAAMEIIMKNGIERFHRRNVHNQNFINHGQWQSDI